MESVGLSILRMVEQDGQFVTILTFGIVLTIKNFYFTKDKYLELLKLSGVPESTRFKIIGSLLWGLIPLLFTPFIFFGFFFSKLLFDVSYLTDFFGLMAFMCIEHAIRCYKSKKVVNKPI